MRFCYLQFWGKWFIQTVEDFVKMGIVDGGGHISLNISGSLCRNNMSENTFNVRIEVKIFWGILYLPRPSMVAMVGPCRGTGSSLKSADLSKIKNAWKSLHNLLFWNSNLVWLIEMNEMTKGRGQLKKKRFLSGIARIMGGVYPCPNFLALFLEVHFWSIKGVYFFKNANVLNF